MAKFARLDGANTVIETFEHSTLLPSATHIPEIAAQFVPCPDSVIPGAVKAGTKWTNPAPPPPTFAPLAPMAFYMAFTPAERIAIKTSPDAMVKEFWATYELAVQVGQSIDPNLQSVVGGLNYLAAPGCGILASAARVDQIRAGIAQ
jgi:hypothetical protein